MRELSKAIYEAIYEAEYVLTKKLQAGVLKQMKKRNGTATSKKVSRNLPVCAPSRKNTRTTTEEEDRPSQRRART